MKEVMMGCLVAVLLAAGTRAQEASSLPGGFVPAPAGVSVESWVTGLEVPWSLVFLPDGRALVSERGGTVRLIRKGTLEAAPYHEVAGTLARGEGGLMGLALHPQFPRQPYVYAMHTTREGNRVVRLVDQGDKARLDRVVVDGIPAGGAHNGGRIAFGPDGMLYVAAGETFRGDLAQDLASRGGKILRVTPDGEIPRDNPFPNSPVYSYGHRNPQGLAWHPRTGAFFSAEHGPTGERGWAGHDELNRIEPGKNYGWPRVIGAPGDARFVDPILYFKEAVPPTNLAFAGDRLFVATLRSGGLLRVSLEQRNGAYAVTSVERWFCEPSGSRYGRLRDVVAGPDGALYVLTSNRDGRGRPREGDDRILRVSLSGDRRRRGGLTGSFLVLLEGIGRAVGEGLREPESSSRSSSAP
ncbi:MAG: PQQ-dependent sugar dehydrogenase [Armatimonadetes bacterium]|nr:PQQ-dependent sugar dehydrogenase [Armatimonadota bacterium]